MCRIDAAFGLKTIEEKNEPIDRFYQSLDEYCITGKFRDLLIKHFSENWRMTFGDITHIENALATTNAFDTDFDKCVAFLYSETLNYRINEAIKGKLIIRYSTSSQEKIICFIIDIARTFCEKSPYKLYTSKLRDLFSFLRYDELVNFIYGNNYCLTTEFFDDQNLNSLSSDARTEILLDFFYGIVGNTEQPFREIDLSVNELIEIFMANTFVGAPSKRAFRFLTGIEFLRTWVERDAKKGLLNSIYHPVLVKINQIFSELKYQFSLHGEYQNFRFRRIKTEFEFLLLNNMDLSEADSGVRTRWAEELDKHIRSYGHDYLSQDDLSLDKQDDFFVKIQLSYFLEIVNKLSPLQLTIWIQYTIDQDFSDVLNNKDINQYPLSDKQSKWCIASAYDLWQQLFLNSLSSLDIESKIKILSCTAPFPMKLPQNIDIDVDKHWQHHNQWWTHLFFELINSSDFIKYLLPEWTIVARGKSTVHKLLPYIDKSIGILRGELSVEGKTEIQINMYQEQLDKLLGWFDGENSQKALRHRLLLMRSSKYPFVDESIRIYPSSSGYMWFKYLVDLLKEQCHRKISSKDDFIEAAEIFYVNYSKEIAEFCLSRLCLRKGEKTLDGKYNSTQVIETSPIWRQGYLKALTELGFDLNGKVHKTVNFIKQSDPDSDVRSIAGETYKAVRRKATPRQTLQDLKRGIIAAEWWLFICQRQFLELPIDYDAALKTRRQLLRNV